MNYYIYAPNIHTGGGLILLRGFVDTWGDKERTTLVLDARLKFNESFAKGYKVIWVKPLPFCRLLTDLKLKSLIMKDDNLILFNGSPLTFGASANTAIFLQNRLIFNMWLLHRHPFRTKISLYLLSRRVKYLLPKETRYIVQTESMKRELISWIDKKHIIIDVIAFVPSPKFKGSNESKKFDFLFVADGMPHKNHIKLIEAFVLLENSGIRPSLLLTLSKKDWGLLNWVNDVAKNKNLRITVMGDVAHEDIFKLYEMSNALIYPSTSESLGMPLVEAQFYNIPIVASELDYVRDVCDPVEAFDPSSSISISRAIKRYLGYHEQTQSIKSTQDFSNFIKTIFIKEYDDV